MNKTETMYDCYCSQFACLDLIYQSAVGSTAKSTAAPTMESSLDVGSNIGLTIGSDLLNDFTAYYTRYRPDRLLLVGSGTSYHACHASAPFLEICLGIEVNVKIPTALGRLYGERPLAVVVSQSGRSTNTMKAVRQLKAQRIPVITLTDPIDTPVGRAGDLAVWLAAADEQIGPKTRGYAATLCTLCLMALKAGRGIGHLDDDAYETALNDLRTVIDNGATYLDACGQFFDTYADPLKTATHYMFVGKGVSARAAEESALKVLETLCLPAAGYEFEEFLHGPAFCADASLALFMFLSQDEDAPRMRKAAQLIGRATTNVYIIAHDVHLQPSPTQPILHLPCPPYLAAFTDVLLPQLISARLPALMGRSRHTAVSQIAQEMQTKQLSR